MCGRYAIATSRLARIENALGIELPEVQARYNIAPTQSVPVVRLTGNHGYELTDMRWGLIPAWSKEPRTSYATFNARAETVADKTAFRAALPPPAARALEPLELEEAAGETEGRIDGLDPRGHPARGRRGRGHRRRRSRPCCRAPQHDRRRPAGRSAPPAPHPAPPGSRRAGGWGPR